MMGSRASCVLGVALRAAAIISCADWVGAPSSAVAAGNDCEGVYNAQEVAPFFDRAAATRVDVVMLGDSNQVFANTGWDHGWGKALAGRFGMYATGLLSAGENEGNGAGIGYGGPGLGAARRSPAGRVPAAPLPPRPTCA